MDFFSSPRILCVWIGIALVTTAQPGRAENGCGTTVVTSPTTPIVLSNRPEILWSEVKGADQYRVEVSLRVPEGPLLASYDLILHARRFQLPQALVWNRVLVTAKVSAHCPEQGYGTPSNPSEGGRFLALTNQNCPPPSSLALQATHERRRLAWAKAESANGYELTHFSATTGVPMETWKTGLLTQEINPPTEEADIYGIRSICGNQAGPWRFTRLE